MTKHFLACICIALACTVGACSSREDTASPVATPMLTLSRTTVPVGGPVDVTYRFAVAQDAPAFAMPLTVFVHMLNDDGEILWTDDHQPMPPTTEW
jgi:hypothetical protein